MRPTTGRTTAAIVAAVVPDQFLDPRRVLDQLTEHLHERGAETLAEVIGIEVVISEVLLPHVLVRGERARLAGRVMMNMTAVDVTDVPGAAAGDEVVLLGAQNNERITAEQYTLLHIVCHGRFKAGDTILF